MTRLEEHNLWGTIQKGNVRAFEQLFHLYWESLYHNVYWRICDESIAKDIVQELFSHLWEKREQISINETVEGYLRIMARNKVLNYFKSEAIRKKHMGAAGYRPEESVNTTEEILALKEVNSQYQGAIARLPEKMRQIYLLSAEEGRSIEEIARQLTLAPQTVKNQLTAAAKKIRIDLAPLLKSENASIQRFALFFCV